MRCLGRLIALTLAFIFVVLLPFSMWAFNTQTIALSGETYKELFDNEGFYQELVPAVLPAFIEGQDEDLPSDEISLLRAISVLEYDDWKELAPDYVEVGWVEHAVETNLDAFFGWLEGERADLEIVFNTGVLRERLKDLANVPHARNLVDKFPPCSSEQEQEFRGYVAKISGAEFPYCQPSAPALKTFLYRDFPKQLAAAMFHAAEQMPEEVDLIQEMEDDIRARAEEEGEPISHGTFSHQERNEFRSAVRFWKQTLILVFLVPAAMLSLIVIVTVRSTKTFFRWMGWPLIIGSLFTLVPLLFLPLAMREFRVQSQDEVEAGFAVGGKLLAVIMADGMMNLVVDKFTWPILIEAAILIGVGFFFAVLSVLLPDPDVPPVVLVPTQTLPGQPKSAGGVAPEVATRLDGTLPERTPPPAHTPPPERQE